MYGKNFQLQTTCCAGGPRTARCTRSGGALAPAGFGPCSHHLLVGYCGNGRSKACAVDRRLRDPEGHPLSIIACGHCSAALGYRMVAAVTRCLSRQASPTRRTACSGSYGPDARTTRTKREMGALRAPCHSRAPRRAMEADAHAQRGPTHRSRSPEDCACHGCAACPSSQGRVCALGGRLFPPGA